MNSRKKEVLSLLWNEPYKIGHWVGFADLTELHNKWQMCIRDRHKIIEYLCDDCGEPLGNHEGNPYISDGENNYCYDCALKHRLIDADEWLFAHGISIYDHAVYKNGEIIAYQKWGKSFRRDVVLSLIHISLF